MGEGRRYEGSLQQYMSSLNLNNQMQKIHSYALILSKFEGIDEQIIKIPMYL